MGVAVNGALTIVESRGGTKFDSESCTHTQVVWTISEEKRELS